MLRWPSTTQPQPSRSLSADRKPAIAGMAARPATPNEPLVVQESPTVQYRTDLVARWYFGGISSALGNICVQPLDVMKVLRQTHIGRVSDQKNLFRTAIEIARINGFTALYSGLSSKILLNLTANNTRMAIYEMCKQSMGSSGTVSYIPFWQKVLLSGFSGAVGGAVGTPFEKVTVRMQSDLRLPPHLRYNYKHPFHGLADIYRSEGMGYLFSGVSLTAFRGSLVAIGLLSMYDQIKLILLTKLPVKWRLKDSVGAHILASTSAGVIASTLIQPADVIKTRLMSNKAGHYKGLIDCGRSIWTEAGLMGFYKGYTPAVVRQTPLAVLTFLIFEQLRKNFGREMVVRIELDPGTQLTSTASRKF